MLQISISILWELNLYSFSARPFENSMTKTIPKIINLKLFCLCVTINCSICVIFQGNKGKNNNKSITLKKILWNIPLLVYEFSLNIPWMIANATNTTNFLSSKSLSSKTNWINFLKHFIHHSVLWIWDSFAIFTL